MNFFLRELINRVISYLIRVSKGETYEEKIEQLLKKALLLAFMALILAATMTSKYMVAGWYLDDLESSFGKIDTFMGTQQENMNQLFRINGDQYNTILKLNRENKEMKADIQFLLANQKLLEEENEKLKVKKQKGK